MNIEPKFEPLAFSTNDWPVMPVACWTPGVFRAIFSIWRITASVRSVEAASGSCTLTIR